MGCLVAACKPIHSQILSLARCGAIRCRITVEGCPEANMASTSTQSDDQRTLPREGAIYRDRANNVIRLLSSFEGYCFYVYVALANPQSPMHGPVTGLTRRDVFEADFVFVAGSFEDWIGNRGKKSNGRTDALHMSLPAVRSMSRWIEPRDWPVRLGIVSRSSHREHIVRRAS